MGANTTRPFYKDQLEYEQAFTAPKGITPELMESGLNDLTYIFIRLLLWVMIYQILSFMTTAIIKWIEKCVKQKKRTRKDRHAPPKERPNTQPTPEIQRMGPTMI